MSPLRTDHSIAAGEVKEHPRRSRRHQKRVLGKFFDDAFLHLLQHMNVNLTERRRNLFRDAFEPPAGYGSNRRARNREDDALSKQAMSLETSREHAKLNHRAN